MPWFKTLVWIVLAATAAVVLASAPAAAADNALVAFGSSMRFRANTSDPGIDATWMTEGFDDAAWSAGTYGVGYETTPPGATNLVRTSVPSSSYSVYTRARFNVSDLGAIGKIWFGADYDDGYVAWINGVQISRSSSMPAGAPTWRTNAASHESSNGTSPNYGTLVDVTSAALGALHVGDNVLAVGVWNNGAPTSSDLVVVPRLSWQCHVPITRGPYLQLGTPTSVTVRWRTATAAASRVRYGPAPGNLTSFADVATPVTEHVVTLTGLLPGTTYVYAVGSATETCAGDDPTYAFETAPAPGVEAPLRIWAIGDAGTGTTSAKAVRDAYTAYTAGTRTNLWFLLGDNAYNAGTDAEYQAMFFDVYPDMLRKSVVWPTLGNHDGGSADSGTQSGPYYDIFSLPRAAEAGGLASGTEAYYAFDWGNVHFIVLDSFDSSRSATGPMLTWLRQDVMATAKDWVIAVWHHPPYSKGSHNSDAEIELMEMRQNALPILEAAGVDLVLSGHSHSYERSFLLDGHYGLSSTLTPAMKLDPGDGRIDGQGAYLKATPGPAAHEGAVYVVAGSSGQIGGGTLNHPAMFVSLNQLGSLVLDIRGRQLDGTFIDDRGAVRDHFTMAKGSAAPPVADFSGQPPSGTVPLAVSFQDLSQGTATMWEWDFQNDGTTDATVRSPSFTYVAPGLYGVRLVARNAFGSDAEIKSGYVCARSAAGTGDVDGDGRPDGSDVCPCVADPAQTDTDGDGAGNACDPDDDGDGALDAADCAPLDASSWAPPVAVGASLRAGPSRDQIGWGASAGQTLWSLYRGLVPAGAAFSYGHTCFEARSADTASLDSATPPPQAWLYYLVSGVNGCGESSLGSASSGAQRPNGAPCP